MGTTRELLGLRIKEFRRRRQLSQEQLAEKIDIDPKHLSRIEVGRSYPSLETLEKIAIALNAEMKDFFEFQHLDSTAEVEDAIKGLLESARDEDLKRILKILRALLK